MGPLIPFMLLILDLPDGGQGQPELERHPALYSSEEQCLRAARELVEERMATNGEGGRSLHTWCMKAPGAGEFDRLMEQMEGENGRPGSNAP